MVDLDVKETANVLAYFDQHFSLRINPAVREAEKYLSKAMRRVRKPVDDTPLHPASVGPHRNCVKKDVSACSDICIRRICTVLKRSVVFVGLSRIPFEAYRL